MKKYTPLCVIHGTGKTLRSGIIRYKTVAGRSVLAIPMYYIHNAEYIPEEIEKALVEFEGYVWAYLSTFTPHMIKDSDIDNLVKDMLSIPRKFDTKKKEKRTCAKDKKESKHITTAQITNKKNAHDIFYG